jgi:hypothetical protein
VAVVIPMQTMQGYLLAAVSGSLGRFSFDIQTGLVALPFYPVEDPPVFIDIKEYQQAYYSGPRNPDSSLSYTLI